MNKPMKNFGAVSGMVYLATRPTVRGLFTLLPVAVGVAGAALIAFSFCSSLWLAFHDDLAKPDASEPVCLISEARKSTAIGSRVVVSSSSGIRVSTS